ncbi:DUF429 domain-containing protein [Puteibacter caeruleilacunae]|nr:DUF429 domain-containing protein [Puteibacter caeruleilacunae]
MKSSATNYSNTKMHVNHNSSAAPVLVGIDACKAGWLCVFYDLKNYTWGLFESLHLMLHHTPSLQQILIDMPIGLSDENHPRTIDSLLRKQLPRRGSTVFNVPCREAVYASDKTQAREANIKVEGKSISEQSLNICGKIKELDELAQHLPPHLRMYECHPEFSFKKLNNNQVVMSKKSTNEGILERLHIIESHDSKLVKLYDEMFSTLKRKDAKSDDILDAICLCLINKLSLLKGLSYLKDDNTHDKTGIPFQVAYIEL